MLKSEVEIWSEERPYCKKMQQKNRKEKQRLRLMLLLAISQLVKQQKHQMDKAAGSKLA